ncbi:serine dehydrogenasease, partial [Enterobacter bugandensis]|nr:serine dehydrogenasease [Enterobacter bugandensis]
MDYASSLGPIDPQVQSSDGKWVPALGYLDKVEEIIAKSASGSITQAELMMVNNLDLAELRRYEEARELSKDLLKKWLVEFKFRDWQVHETNAAKLGQPVNQD